MAHRSLALWVDHVVNWLGAHAVAGTPVAGPSPPAGGPNPSPVARAHRAALPRPHRTAVGALARSAHRWGGRARGPGAAAALHGQPAQHGPLLPAARRADPGRLSVGDAPAPAAGEPPDARAAGGSSSCSPPTATTRCGAWRRGRGSAGSPSGCTSAQPFHIGLNRWYVTAGSGVLKVRRGVVEELGIADRRLPARPRRPAPAPAQLHRRLSTDAATSAEGVEQQRAQLPAVPGDARRRRQLDGRRTARWPPRSSARSSARAQAMSRGVSPMTIVRLAREAHAAAGRPAGGRSPGAWRGPRSPSRSPPGRRECGTDARPLELEARHRLVVAGHQRQPARRRGPPARPAGQRSPAARGRTDRAGTAARRPRSRRRARHRRARRSAGRRPRRSAAAPGRSPRRSAPPATGRPAPPRRRCTPWTSCSATCKRLGVRRRRPRRRGSRRCRTAAGWAPGTPVSAGTTCPARAASRRRRSAWRRSRCPTAPPAPPEECM